MTANMCGGKVGVVWVGMALAVALAINDYNFNFNCQPKHDPSVNTHACAPLH